MSERMTLQAYWEALNTFDWFHMYSDDFQVYRAGEQRWKELDQIARKARNEGDPCYWEMFEAFQDHFWGRHDEEPPPKPAKPDGEASPLGAWEANR